MKYVGTGLCARPHKGPARRPAPTLRIGFYEQKDWFKTES